MDPIYVIVASISFALLVIAVGLYLLHRRCISYKNNAIEFLTNEEKQKIKQKALQDSQQFQTDLAVLAERKINLENDISKSEYLINQLDHARQIAENNFNQFKETQQATIEKEINEWTQSAQEAANERSEAYQEQLNHIKDEIASVQAVLDEYRRKRDTINQEILNARAIEEKQDFYRINIPDSDLSDISLLTSLKSQLHRSAALDKLIYDNYIAKPVLEMTRRVLSGKDPSGIYKVTYIKTGEIYIGQSVKVASRWKNHVKSAYGLEGVADSVFQRALKKYGVQNFTWELLEEVPKEQLTEREKYYITFYDTIHYGFNMKI